jgi:endoglucanase
VDTNWWIDREWGPLWRQHRAFKRQGKPGSAALVRKLALHPNFKWFGTWDHHPRNDVRKYLARVGQQQPGSVPQMTIMRRIHRRCHSRYDGGGPAENAAYMRWIRAFASGIGNSRVVLAYEPDSLGTLECLSRAHRGGRLRLHRAAVDVLSKLPNATIYLEGGASDWRPARVIARRLGAIGIRKVRGFMVNVTHHDWTRNNVRYCREVSRRVGGKHCVISTTDNGNGPLRFKRWRDRRRNIWYWENIWCNPPNGAAGPPPKVSPLGAGHVVDAYLWIGRPGYSGGTCNGGPARGAGTFWPELAVRLARRARW